MEITYQEARVLDGLQFVDVRAPVEFNVDHIPGAINIPLFDDVERAVIGTLYKDRGEAVAFEKGQEFVRGKIDTIVESIRNIVLKGDVVLYCFRGGMRSQSIAALLKSLGIPVKKLSGGYKAYRRAVLEFFSNLDIDQPMFVLHGLTGTGKTEILRRIPEAIDLEGMAEHRSSVFGAIGLQPASQKLFESRLKFTLEMRRTGDFLVIEGESRKIGDLHIPERLFTVMNCSPGILVRADMERRVDILIKEYALAEDRREIINITETLETRIGKRNVAVLRGFIEKDKLRDFAEFLLEKYYDPFYLHTLKKMKYLAVIDNRDSGEAAGAVVSAIRGYLNSPMGHGYIVGGGSLLF